MLKKIDHIGIEVEDLQHIVERFTALGLTCSEVSEREDIGLKMAFFPIGDTVIEFINISPEKRREALYTLLRSEEGAVNHICFKVDNLDVSIQDFEKSGARLIDGYPSQGAHGRIAFFDPKTTGGVLVELCQI